MFLSERIGSPAQCRLSFDVGRILLTSCVAMNQYERGKGCASSRGGTNSSLGTLTKSKALLSISVSEEDRSFKASRKSK